MNNNDVNISELVDQLQMEIDNQAPIQDTAIEVVPDVVPDLRDEEENLNLFEHTQEAIDIYAYNSKGVLRQIPDYHLVNRR